ncbi:MAG TPA: hypothetical protein VE778_05785 [Candidatus Bathyarchaeia archaeon]|jgi:hypothetical protein|nr:hypothetical protein [Candidatus Bathyarchaeia archaeon]
MIAMKEHKEHEVTEAYNSLKRAIRRGDDRSAAQMVRNLLSTQDGSEVWRFLLTAASSELGYRDQHDQQTTILVRSLYENWALHKDPVFAVHAVLALTFAPKGTSARDYIALRTD